jgi:hypothetical protein
MSCTALCPPARQMALPQLYLGNRLTIELELADPDGVPVPMEGYVLRMLLIPARPAAAAPVISLSSAADPTLIQLDTPEQGMATLTIPADQTATLVAGLAYRLVIDRYEVAAPSTTLDTLAWADVSFIRLGSPTPPAA